MRGLALPEKSNVSSDSTLLSGMICKHLLATLVEYSQSVSEHESAIRSWLINAANRTLIWIDWHRSRLFVRFTWQLLSWSDHAYIALCCVWHLMCNFLEKNGFVICLSISIDNKFESIADYWSNNKRSNDNNNNSIHIASATRRRRQQQQQQHHRQYNNLTRHHD